jgi:hypothetical protein
MNTIHDTHVYKHQVAQMEQTLNHKIQRGAVTLIGAITNVTCV